MLLVDLSGVCLLSDRGTFVRGVADEDGQGVLVQYSERLGPTPVATRQ